MKDLEQDPSDLEAVIEEAEVEAADAASGEERDAVPGDVTQLLLAHERGESGAFDQLMNEVYADLRRIASRQLRRRGPQRLLETTGLVHEAYLKLVDHTRTSYQSRAHFLNVSARAMRQIVVDHARRSLAVKRGGDQIHTTLEPARVASDQDATHVLEVHEALERLMELDEQMVRVVECRFFAGLTEAETAEALDSSLRTVQRTWARARAWLKEEMRGAD